MLKFLLRCKRSNLFGNQIQQEVFRCVIKYMCLINIAQVLLGTLLNRFHVGLGISIISEPLDLHQNLS